MYSHKWIYIDTSNAYPEQKGLFCRSSCSGQKKTPKDTYILVPEGNDVPLHCKRELNYLVEQL